MAQPQVTWNSLIGFRCVSWLLSRLCWPFSWLSQFCLNSAVSFYIFRKQYIDSPDKRKALFFLHFSERSFGFFEYQNDYCLLENLQLTLKLRILNAMTPAYSSFPFNCIYFSIILICLNKSNYR